MIIVEGPDGAGKSYLINLLREKGYMVPMQSSPKQFNNNCKIVENAIKDPYLPGAMIAFDRICVLSELVYGPVLRGNTRIGLVPALGTISRLLEKRSMSIILFMDSDSDEPPILKTKAWKDEKLVKGVTDNYIRIRAMYKELSNITESYFGDYKNIVVMRFTNDFESDTMKQLVKQLEEILCVES